jgi:hypothetical protein
MKTKNLTVLAVLLIVIIGIIVIANQLSNKKPSEESLVFLPEFSLPACAEMLVVEGKDSAKIARRGTKWMVVPVKSVSAGQTASPIAQPGGTAAPQSVDEEYPADSAAVQTALEKLKSLKKDDLISRNPQKQGELEVDSAKGIFVEPFNDKGKSMGAFYIGKNGPNWDAHFIRAKGSSDVYLASGSVRFSFFGSPQRWKDKSIVRFDKAFVKTLSIVNGDSGTAVELTRIAPSSPKDTTVKEGWEMVKPEKFKAKKEKADEIVNALSTFAAAEFETDRALTPDSMGFTKPKLVVSVTLQNGETKTVIIGKKKGSSGQYWAKNPENTKAIFLIQEYNINNINFGPAALKDVPEVKKDTDKASAKPGKPAKSVKPVNVKPATKKAEAKKK